MVGVHHSFPYSDVMERRLKVTKRASQLEMLSAQELSLDQVTAVVDNEEM